MEGNSDVPSPQCVGQEFVRQYYTMLNKAPDFMHRFYSHDSSFVHGGIEKPGEELPPIRGQMAIHQKIQSLNFKDCHAKICQVDSQASVADAVVVQVAGELSNSGQPMRRFLQTFVLAPQSPKKYYVYNDIFRYQDEVFHDSELDGELEVTDSSMLGGTNNTVSVAPSVAAVRVEPEINNTNINNSVAPLTQERPPSAISEVAVTKSESLTQASALIIQPDDSTMIAESFSAVQLSAELAAATEQQTTAAVRPSGSATSIRTSGAASPLPPSVSVSQETLESASPASHTTGEAPKPTAVGTMSWAALAGKNAPGGSTVTVPAPVAAPVTPTSKPQATVKPEVKPDTVNSNMNAVSPQQQQQRNSKPVERGSMERDLNNGNVGSGGDFDDAARRVFPDEQQLFVGNLPHATSNEELKEFFSQFGAVLDVRINRKGPARDVPNFGFVTLDSAEAVQKVLVKRPLFLGNKHRLNIEEKKPPSDFGGGPAGNRAGPPRGEVQRGGFKGGFPSGGRGGNGGVVSFRGGRGTWRGNRSRGGGFGAGGSYRSQNDDNGSGEEMY